MSDRLKERYNRQYEEANRAVKRKARADKPAFMEVLANKAEVAASKGDVMSGMLCVMLRKP